MAPSGGLDSLKSSVLELFQRGRWSLTQLAPHFHKSCRARAARTLGLDSALLEPMHRQAISLAAFGSIDSEAAIHGFSSKRFVFEGEQPSSENAVFLSLLQKIYPEASLWRASTRFLDLLKVAEANLGTGQLAPIIEHWLESYVLVTGLSFRSASMPQAFGAIVLSDKCDGFDPHSLCVSIVHELAHQELFLINTIDRLIEPEFDQSTRYAPFQKKDRPPIGRLHSLIALFRMIQYNVEQDRDCQRWREEFLATVPTLQAPELTPFGLNLVQQMSRHVQSGFADADAVAG